MYDWECERSGQHDLDLRPTKKGYLGHDLKPDVHDSSRQFNNHEDLDDVRWCKTDMNIQKWWHHDTRGQHDIDGHIEGQYWQDSRCMNLYIGDGQGFYNYAANSDKEDCYDGYVDDPRACYEAYRPTKKPYDGYDWEWREPQGSSREVERHDHLQILEQGRRYGYCDTYNAYGPHDDGGHRQSYKEDEYELCHQASQATYARPSHPDESRGFRRRDFSREGYDNYLHSPPQLRRHNNTAERYFDVSTESRRMSERSNDDNESRRYLVEMARSRGFCGRDLLRGSYGHALRSWLQQKREDYKVEGYINVGTESQKTAEWSDADNESRNRAIEMSRSHVSSNDCDSYEVPPSMEVVRQNTPDRDENVPEPHLVKVPELVLSPVAFRLSLRGGGGGMRRAALTPTTFCPDDNSSDAHGNRLEVPTQKVCRRERSASVETMGSQKFATMKNARRIAQDLGMIEAEEETEQQEADEVEKEHGGRVSRSQWAKRNQLQKAPREADDKFDMWDFKSLKAMRKASEMSKDVTGWLTMWSSSLKTIEGHFGTGVASYFLFLRWLLLLNVLMFLMPVLFIILPHWVFPGPGRFGSDVSSSNHTSSSSLVSPSSPAPLPSPMALLQTSLPLPLPLITNSSFGEFMSVAAMQPNRTRKLVQECYESYHERVAGQTKEGISQLQDLLQGTGWMELTALFAGRYLNSVDYVPGTMLHYNFPLAYVLTNVACFALCLLLMVRYTTTGVREALMVSEGKLHRYCNLVFASWDFCITDERTARLKHISIIQELKSDLAEERRNMEKALWSRGKKVALLVVRVAINLVVVAVITGALFAVYQATSFSFGEQARVQSEEGMLALVVQFVPSLVITGLNLVVPVLFSKLILLENFSVDFQVKLTLLRTVFLRFTSIIVLLLSLYKQINCKADQLGQCLEANEDSCKKPLCWETAVGQQIYKLTILDFVVGVTIVFLVECPRKLLVTRCDCKLAKIVGQQEFNIPNRVLDLVYSQTLCWLGTFYCPLLPAISIIKYLIIFYVQKFTLMNNSRPSQTPYRASRSNTFFVIVLLLALFLAMVPFAYALVEIPPSVACGPFQRFSATWDVVRQNVHSWGWPLVNIVDFLTSVAFAVPAVVVLAISIYYYYSVSSAHSHMEKLLKDKLVLEGKDKQFLLARITEVARHQAAAS